MAAPIALVTCADIPDLEEDDQLLIEPLDEHGRTATPVVWDDPKVDWDAYGLAVLRSPWDYTPRREEFVAWAASVPRLANPAAMVAWNTDKRYLADLADAGAPIVPTSWIAPAEAPGASGPVSNGWRPPVDGHWVVKPSISAGSRDTGRYDMSRVDHREQAKSHLDRLLADNRTVMIQPYLAAVDTCGETALMFVASPSGVEFSHAIRKGPLLEGPDFGTTGLYKRESVTSRVPTAAELAVARRVLAAVPRELGSILYARVDLIPGPAGEPTLIELELTEPSLFLGFAAGAPGRFADAIAAASE